MSQKVQTACSQGIRRALRLGAQSLEPQTAQSVRAFLLSQMNADGGFRGRSPQSDLYYTVFGLECAEALGLELPRTNIRNFVEKQAPAVGDFVHLTCLARCRELLWSNSEVPAWAEQARSRLTTHACPEGGYHQQPAKPRGTVYESFLGMLACEAFGEPFPLPEQTMRCLAGLEKNSGGYVNGQGFAAPTTPVTAAALGLAWELKAPAPAKSLEWLLSRHSSQGGFKAAALVPLPDLLSTATALHALRTHGRLDGANRSACLEFVSSLWDETGGFCGHAFDSKPDCEYTFYGLLALGNLATE